VNADRSWERNILIQSAIPFGRHDMGSLEVSNSMLSWRQENAALSRDDVHLLYSPLDLPTSRLKLLAATLSTDERSRAEAYYSDRERTRFIACRGVLRTILGHYSSVEPKVIRFHYGSRGKPSLAEEYGKNRIQFSIAHSGGLAVYAFTLGRNIGVDLERVVPFAEVIAFADRFFSIRERSALHALSGNEQYETFFKIWTGKEAYLKACGEDLTCALNEIDVALNRNKSSLVMTNGDARSDSPCTLTHFRLGSDFIVALVVEASNFHLTRWLWSIP